jgi:long-chain acyl-CoA synthetase
MNIANLLQRSGLIAGSNHAVMHGTEPLLNYTQLARRAAVLAGHLRHQFGLQPGERVALAMKNSPAYIELLFAAWHAGLVAVPINAKLHQREFEYILADSGARLCFVTHDLAKTLVPLQQTLPQLAHVIDVDSSNYLVLLHGDSLALEPRASADIAWLFYTSGTTGQPKGAMLTHGNLLCATWCYFTDVDQIAPSDCIVHAAPMSHGSGLYILPHVVQAAANVIPKSGGFFEPEIFGLIAAHPGVTLFAAPTMVKRLAEHRLARDTSTRHLKTIVYGGGPMYLADLLHAQEVFGYKLAQIYGQGESPMTITALAKTRHCDVQHPRYRERLNSVGIPFAGLEVMVADSDDRPLPAGTVGEILVRGASVMAGYWQNPEATAQTLYNGWLHTGDLGSFDEDGFLTLSDRSKDLIISGGSNIYPREIEELLLRHPAVKEIGVVGAVDAEWGERVVAFVVASAGYSAGQKELAGELDAYCQQHIARFKRPKDYRFVDDLPKNNYGKILKTTLREWL